MKRQIKSIEKERTGWLQCRIAGGGDAWRQGLPRQWPRPPQGRGHSVEVGIREQPAAVADLGEPLASAARQGPSLMVERAVETRDKRHQVVARIARPQAGEEMVVDDVHQNGRVAAKRWSETGHAAAENRMRVGETVDRPVLPDPMLEFLRHDTQLVLPDHVRQQVADPRAGIGVGEIQVGQPVHRAMRHHGRGGRLCPIGGAFRAESFDRSRQGNDGCHHARGKPTMTAHETPDKRRAMIPMVIAILVSLIAGGIAPGLVVVSKAGTCGKAGLSLATGELPS